SSFHGLTAGPQDAPSVILAAAGAGLVAASDQPVASLAAFTILASGVTGVVLVVMGRFRLGNLLRYAPFPVVAGFLGGTGVVLATAGIDLLRGAEAGASQLWLRLIPGLALGLAIAVLGRRGVSAVVSVLAIAIGFVGYHLMAVIAGIPRSDGIGRGLLLGPFPEGRLFDAGVIRELGSADWGAIAGQLPAVAAMVMIVPLALLLNTGALEHTFKVDIDADRELMATGAGLLAAAPFAGLPGYVQMSDTVIGRRIGGDSRLPPLIGAAVAAATLAIGADVISLVPVLIPAGLLLAIGLDFILTWVWDVRHRVGRLEHAVIVAIVATVAVAGFLPGVALGVVAATVLFVVRYSRIPAVRTLATARDRRSNVQRSPAEETRLTEVGDRIVLAELQGFLFFGKAEQIVRSVRQSLEAHSQAEALIVDLRRVTGMDSSAGASFDRLARFAEDREMEVVFCGAGAEVKAVLEPVLRHDAVRYQVDLDRALEAGEDELLEGQASDVLSPDHSGSPPWEGLPAITVAAGAALVTEGERHPGIFYIESGRASIAPAPGDTTAVRRAVLLAGSIVGELSHLTGDPAMATVVCDTPCVVRHMSRQWLDDLVDTDPARALALERVIASRLADKLIAANRTIRALS
ncbi:MAG: SulP family inorganic anion transporter, partial [Actinomycetota bacterium]|nr:SulP family inorganic anion transporter [Actinomycetota bacterium]